MIKKVNTIVINESVSRISNWFINEITHKYQSIHPKDHLGLKLLTDMPIREGSVFQLSENIGGKFKLNTKVVITMLTDHSFAFRCLFPYSLLNVQARFTAQAIDSTKTQLIAVNQVGFNFPVVGKIIDILVGFFLTESILKTHMYEENLGIKREIETR